MEGRGVGKVALRARRRRASSLAGFHAFPLRAGYFTRMRTLDADGSGRRQTSFYSNVDESASDFVPATLRPINLPVAHSVSSRRSLLRAVSRQEVQPRGAAGPLSSRVCARRCLGGGAGRSARDREAGSAARSSSLAAFRGMSPFRGHHALHGKFVLIFVDGSRHTIKGHRLS